MAAAKPDLPSDLEFESGAFDRQIQERLENGFIPDLRRCQPTDWFYNNPWRRPAYVKLDIGEQFELIAGAIRDHAHAQPEGNLRVLEVGCGPGFLTLELARNGFDVMGIDLSAASVEVARKFADEDPWKDERGALEYAAGDFSTSPALEGRTFDAIVFLGALHHFPDQDGVLRRCSDLLAPGGVVVAHEPTRDRVTPGNAALVHLLRVLLSAGDGFHAPEPVPTTAEELERSISRLFATLRYEDEKGGKVQSVNDNAAGRVEMEAALSRVFETVEVRDRYAFFHEVIGGLRFAESLNEALAWYLREIDRRLVEAGVLSATEFFYVGRQRGAATSA